MCAGVKYYVHFVIPYMSLGNMEITLALSPEVNTYMSDRIKVAEYHAMYINFRKLVRAK